jgi:PEP-CTERM motif
MNIESLAGAFLITLSVGSPVWASNLTPYYLFDGDSSHAVEILNGSVVNAFNTFSLGYPVAITNTIWLGNRDNTGGAQYTLGGVATGATSAGGTFISQILDGTTNGVNNFGVTCCAATNIVTIANANWSNQQRLFALSGAGAGGAEGITFDTANNHLFVSTFSDVLQEYSLTGTLISSTSLNHNIAGLAYEQATDTLWGWDRGTSSLDQFSTSGALLQSQNINVSVFGVFNPFGGEMSISAVPEPSTWAMMLLGFAGVGFMAYRRKPTMMAA